MAITIFYLSAGNTGFSFDTPPSSISTPGANAVLPGGVFEAPVANEHISKLFLLRQYGLFTGLTAVLITIIHHLGIFSVIDDKRHILF